MPAAARARAFQTSEEKPRASANRSGTTILTSGRIVASTCITADLSRRSGAAKHSPPDLMLRGFSSVCFSTIPMRRRQQSAPWSGSTHARLRGLVRGSVTERAE
jgi:hypothetical protein